MSAELFPCRRCKKMSEYADFCSQKCAREWKGFHEQEIEDLKSQLTDAQDENKVLKAKLAKAVEQRNKEAKRINYNHTSKWTIDSYDQELNQIGQVTDPRDVQIKVLEKKLEKCKEQRNSYYYISTKDIDVSESIYNMDKYLSAITPESLGEE